MHLVTDPLHTDEEGRRVVTYAFAPDETPSPGETLSPEETVSR